MAGIVLRAAGFVLPLIMIVLTASSAFAGDNGSEWNSVIRPDVNVGTGTADYSVDLFSPLYQDGTSMLFFNPRFRINPGREDENEFNVGLGYRRLILNDSWFVGVNAYFDTMESRYDNRYNQVGLGIEARSQWLDLFMNGYIVTGDDTNRVDGIDKIILGNTWIGLYRGEEQAMSGMDAEMGVLVPYLSDYMETRAYVGGYWWLSDINDDIVGVKGRIEVNPVPLVTVNGIFNYDDVQKDVWRGEAYLNIPFSFTNLVHGENPFEGIGDSLKWGGGARTASERMTDRVERDRYIRTVRGTEGRPSEVMNVIYVDPTNTSGIEDGTLQHPYNTLQEAIDNLGGDYYAIFIIGEYPDISPPVDTPSLHDIIWGP